MSLSMLHPPDWTPALCAQTDPDAFFPDQGEDPGPALKICQRCPIKTECLEYALAADERYGVWGGVSANQRRRIQEEQGA